MGDTWSLLFLSETVDLFVKYICKIPEFGSVLLSLNAPSFSFPLFVPKM